MPSQQQYKTREEYNAYHKEYRRKNREKIRKYKREYNKRWRKDNGLDNDLQRNKKWLKKNPEKIRAEHKLHYAVEKGELTRPENCENCGSSKYIESHHEDYTKPLTVIWLCKSCHKQTHLGYISIDYLWKSKLKGLTKTT